MIHTSDTNQNISEVHGEGKQYNTFGIIDYIMKKCLIEVVPNCSKEVLLPII